MSQTKRLEESIKQAELVRDGDLADPDVDLDDVDRDHLDVAISRLETVAERIEFRRQDETEQEGST